MEFFILGCAVSFFIFLTSKKTKDLDREVSNEPQSKDNFVEIDEVMYPDTKQKEEDHNNAIPG